MRVDAAQTAKALGARAHAAEIRQFDAMRIADDDVLDATLAIDEHSDLTPRFVR